MGTIANTRAAASRLSDGGRIIFVGSLLGAAVPFPGVVDELPNRDLILDMHPIHRTATLEEVAQTVCFLAGPSAGYISGQAINIAGWLAI